MLSARTLTEEQTLIRRNFIDFFESERYELKYNQRIQEMIAAAKARLILDMGDLLDFTPSGIAGGFMGNEADASPGPGDVSLGFSLLREPGKYLPLLELALHDIVLRQQPEYLKVDYRSRVVRAGFEGPVGRVLSPRELYARHLNTLVALEGIVTRQSTNRPRVIETVHYCVETNRFSKKEYRDQLTPMLDGSHLPTVNVMPKTDMEGHALRTELGLSTFVDSQCSILQEAPERAPTGQLPRNVELRFDDDLVDCVKPGDRVVLVGVYMPYTTADSKRFQSIVLVNNVVSMQLQQQTTLYRSIPSLQDDLVSFAQKCILQDGPSGVLRTLSKGIAPSIHGLVNEKRAILLLMVGGVERHANSTRIRGDINILLVGEPSTAKSQLLRFVLGVAPLALSTTGKGSSGVGLTAAVAADSYTGERSLSAGAMVLADRGILCVDEFDKMSPEDRVSMHEAMEQQTVTIAKAGIHASLNARCSVLAAANPVYGFYSVRHTLAYNVGLPESLLSRFDLTFIVLDQHSSQHNRRIGTHILRNHMTATPVTVDEVISKTTVESMAAAAHVADGTAARGSGNRGGGGEAMNAEAAARFRMTTNSVGEAIVTVDFLKAYIQLAKSGAPLLTDASRELVCQHYVQLREEQKQQQEEGRRDGFHITARTLEAIIRLSTAHAKLRLSAIVEEEDVHGAMELLRASVHAASSAATQRQEDNQATTEEYRRQRLAQRGNAPNDDVPSRATGAHENGNNKRPREESSSRRDERPSGASTGMESPGNASRDSVGDTVPAADSGEREENSALLKSREQQRLSALQAQVSTALQSFQREQRMTVQLHELRDRVGLNVQPADLQHVLSEMQGDDFVYESTETEDTIQFL